MEKTITIEGKEFKIREIRYIEALEVEELRQKNLSESVKKLVMLSTGLSDDEVKALSLKEGTKIQEEINKINGFGDFQKLTTQ